ncbi:MAG: hypothetical protein HC799_07185 [Limnothrix sp. RL_2_0]|nr:hypothetical protein [Limnothrix sp. RL_2_0]
MAVAPRPWQTPQLSVKSRRFKSRANKPARMPLARPAKPVPIRKAASAPLSSTKIKVFAMGQRLTQFLAIASVATAVSLYACTVYNQKIWGKEYAQLTRLQEDERGMVTSNEGIKEQLIEQADQPEIGLSSPTPDQNLYVPAPKALPLRPQAASSQAPIDNQAPIGY